MDTEVSSEESNPRGKRRSPWDILGVERGASWEEVRAAFLKNARRLHPDKGGDPERFKELQAAYESIRAAMEGVDLEDGTSSAEDNKEVWEELERWVDWAGRWGKRLLGDPSKGGETHKDSEILRIRIPWKLLEDRNQMVRVEYDGWPIRVPLGGTETIGAIGLRVRLVPQAEYRTVGVSGEEVIMKVTQDPWRTDICWLFDIPEGATGFRINGGDWQSTPGDYGRGVSWRFV